MSDQGVRSALPKRLREHNEDHHHQWKEVKTIEQIEVEEKLNQLIGRINAQKYTIVEPSKFDQEMKSLVPNLRIMNANPHIISLQTIIRDKYVILDLFCLLL